jgi:hypothetical protein
VPKKKRRNEPKKKVRRLRTKRSGNSGSFTASLKKRSTLAMALDVSYRGEIERNWKFGNYRLNFFGDKNIRLLH